MRTESADDLPPFAWRPAPKVLPFPLARRRDLITRHARRMAEFRPQKAEEHLNRLLRDTGLKLVGMGCDPAMVGQQIEELETAIRSHHARFRAIIDSDGAA